MKELVKEDHEAVARAVRRQRVMFREGLLSGVALPKHAIPRTLELMQQNARVLQTMGVSHGFLVLKRIGNKLQYVEATAHGH